MASNALVFPAMAPLGLADSEAFEAIAVELRRLAAVAMRRERPDHTLQPTALVNEAYLRLTGDRAAQWQSPAHFYGSAARAMRQILVDHARRRQTGKRGGGALPVEFDEAVAGMAQPDHEQLLMIDDALTRLSEADARAAKVVELRFFAGLGFDEVAAALGVSNKTAKRDWEFARVWLERDLRRQ